MTAQQINKYRSHFKQIYNNSGEEINPMPEGVKLTVFCTDYGDNIGFAENCTRLELGINALIAKSWIKHDDLLALISNQGNQQREKQQHKQSKRARSNTL